MTKFNIGDRVQFYATAPDTAYTDQPRTPSHLDGSRGTVVRASIGGVVRVNWDEGSAARRAYAATSFSKDGSNAASFTENLVLVTEPKPIAEGDRVEWLGFVKRNLGEPSRPIGTLGTVDWVPPFNPGNETDTVHVRWDNDGNVGGTWLANIKHASEPTTSTITPESVREQAVAKRAEANDIAKQITELVDKRNALQRDASDLDAAAQTIERLATP